MCPILPPKQWILLTEEEHAVDILVCVQDVRWVNLVEAGGLVRGGIEILYKDKESILIYVPGIDFQSKVIENYKYIIKGITGE